MSIIEQALDKLERTESSFVDQAVTIPNEFRVPQPTSTFSKSLSILLILLGFLTIIIVFTISQLGVIPSPETSHKNKINLIKPIEPKKSLNNKNDKIIENNIQIEADLPSDRHQITISKEPNFKPQTSIPKQTIHTPELLNKRVDNITVTQKILPSEQIEQENQITNKVLEPVIKKQNNLPQLTSEIVRKIKFGDYQKVLSILQKYQHELKETWEYYYWQSQAYIGLNQIMNADQAINIGLKKYDQESLLWIQRGLILQESGDHLAAIETFKKAELLNVKPANLYLNMGYSAAVIGDLSLAKRAYNKFLIMTEDDPANDLSIREQISQYLKQISR